MAEEIGHECGFALLRLLKPPEHYVEKYGTYFFGLNRMYLIMEKQRNRGQDGAGVANVTLDVEPGTKYLHCEKSIAQDPIKDLFRRVQTTAQDRVAKAPASARITEDGKEKVDPMWVKENVPFCGEAFLAHVRYGTDSENTLDRCHPVTRESNWMTRNLILAGNFNITNNEDLFTSLVKIGQHPRELSDTVTLLEKIGHFVDKENNDLYVRYSAAGHDPQTIFSLVAENLNMARILRLASGDWDGGYCIAGLLGHGDAFVMRDPSGIRPAFFFADDEIIVVASEAPLIQTVFGVEGDLVKPLPPGQALTIKRSGTWALETILDPLPEMQCSFERVYFSRGNDAGVYREREALGRFLLEPLLKMLEKGGDSLVNSVLSFIPNTSELAFLGLVKEAQDHLDREKKTLFDEVLKLGADKSKDLDEKMAELLKSKVRMEKVVHKDAKIRTFIQEDASREHLTMHAYDVHYGTIVKNKDVIVALDDSIVRGNTLKNAILRTLDRLSPTRIIIVSSCPQIRFPDVYGIDMAKLGDLAAFKAAIGLLRERDMEHVITKVYQLCKEEMKKPVKSGTIVNHVPDIYSPFTPEEISARISQDVTPADCKAKVEVLYQTVEDLHKALPQHAGDWYFTGKYPTQGGAKVCCRAFVLWMEGSSQRCYGISSALSFYRHTHKAVLVLGSGAREHALAWRLSKSVDVSHVFVAPGNCGMSTFASKAHESDAAPVVRVNLQVKGPDFSDVLVFCREQEVKLVVVGPEQMLSEGIADKLLEAGVNVFGPKQAAAEIESSKAFAKDFMSRHKIPTAEYKVFKGKESLAAALAHVESVSYSVVVKASGLASGKGVVVPGSKAAALEAVRDCLERGKLGDAGLEIVLERKLEGTECSVMALTDGTRIAVLPPAQDHKRAFDDDQGPNTGGMGSFAPTPIVTPALLEQIKQTVLVPAINGLRAEGRPFLGCLYAGLMITPEGPKVMEFNCRFGDPETQVVLPLIDCDLGDVLYQCARGELPEGAVKTLPGTSAVAVVMASAGYPGNFEVGHQISGLERARCAPGVSVFHASTRSALSDDSPAASSRAAVGSSLKVLLRRSSQEQRINRGSGPAVLTAGGRVLCVTAVARGLSEARERAYVGVRSLHFEGAHFRNDIALTVPGGALTTTAAKAVQGTNTYLAAGVDLHMDEAIGSGLVPLMRQTQRVGCDQGDDAITGMGGLCHVGSLGYKDPLMVSSTSGVGTKLKVAIAMENFEGIGADAVALCVNDVAARGAEPIFYMDHCAISRLDAQMSMQIAQGTADACVEARCALLGCRTAEMPGVFSSSNFDLVGFCSGVAERSSLLPKRELMCSGDVIIGLSSSGLHSNGFSLLRSVVKAAGVRYTAAAPFDPTRSFGEVLLTPARIYARALLGLAKTDKLKGAVPITNGGLHRSIPRILPSSLQAVLRADAWQFPAIFRWIAGSFRVPCQEMAATFNCGIGMVCVVAKADKEAVIQILKELHEEPMVIGELVDRGQADEPVRIEGAESAWLMLPELGVSLPFPQVLSSLHDPMSSLRMRVMLVSGSSTFTPLQALIDASEVPAFPAEVTAVAATDECSKILEQAHSAGIATFTLGEGAQATAALEEALQSTSAEYVVLLDDVNPSLLTEDFRQRWGGRLLVVEASLLPRSLGSNPVSAALSRKLRISGCTVYRPSSRSGGVDKILAQESTTVSIDDTVASLHARIVAHCEWKALPEAIRQTAIDTEIERNGGSMSPKAQDADAAAQALRARCASTDASRYDMRGVSADKGDVHAAIKNMDKGLFPRAFCKIVPDSISGDESQALVMHADGAGTKSSLAYMYWKRTGDLSVWKGIAQDAIVMNLDDLLCVGVVDNILLSSTIGRNKTNIPKEVIAELVSGTASFVRDLQEHGVGLSLTGGETADVGDLVRTIIVDSTVVARIPRAHVIDNGRIAPGDIIVGLASSGQATYETSYNSGIGSNGLTAARHDTFEKSLSTEFPESFDPAMPAALVYSGETGLEELVKTPAGDIPAGKLVLSPTRTYAPVMKKILDSGIRDNIHGMIHCSGGAQTKVLHFVQDVHVIKDNLLPTPPVFELIQRSSNTAWAEMYKVFNMGHRMEFYTDKDSAEKIIEISKSFGIHAQVVGRVVAAPGEKRVTIKSEYGEFEYSA
mmetsp:Transcript_9554/g.21307  ORF Transcript_9554/g.21307 Transcript_9554/m.21307 type:complete len:2146 (-) Transcript_9554:573-7010(-)|eukprot:CAMPEP_0170572174 /NCGR_PEP_ID=MMETSP0224-20130122/2071_1 /TAXON_ID=285029 /ORGANISM="Togula jolla, Strain CCCM 725" /LENGTH=2145 /DNA_ID=CAMNT_0010894637 /DNA_START=32 /DNA_END=6469 /DNA_ORIENTATION=+